jgi:hypothetical protein
MKFNILSIAGIALRGDLLSTSGKVIIAILVITNAAIFISIWQVAQETRIEDATSLICKAVEKCTGQVLSSLP